MRELVVSLPPPASASASNSTTPRALLRSLVRLPKYCIRKGNKKGECGSERGEEDQEIVLVQEQSATTEEEREAVVSSGIRTEPVSFNQGIGMGLVFLMVNSASEFNKMKELRKQMEVLLKEIKGEMRRKNEASSYSVSHNYTVLSASHCWGDEITSNPISSQDAAYSDEKCACETNYEKSRCLKINQLEEELEVELERLQRKTEEGSSVLTREQNIEVESMNIDHSESSSANFVEAINEPKQEATRDHNGVCPLELERRLHELLETRQQERIAELETALECAEGKLQEKETEICWWRDTARLVSKHKEVTRTLQVST
ncbi:uncharacterized protein A4U43_C08F18580 [Asparagus officinalis]|nr:uncharacterized protein A4U43_C08F18580 [Asparagus officinalis]